MRDLFKKLKKVVASRTSSISRIGNPASSGNFKVEVESSLDDIIFRERGVLILEDGSSYNTTNTIKWQLIDGNIHMSRKRYNGYEKLFIIGSSSLPHI